MYSKSCSFLHYQYNFYNNPHSRLNWIILDDADLNYTRLALVIDNNGPTTLDYSTMDPFYFRQGEEYCVVFVVFPKDLTSDLALSRFNHSIHRPVVRQVNNLSTRRPIDQNASAVSNHVRCLLHARPYDMLQHPTLYLNHKPLARVGTPPTA